MADPVLILETGAGLIDANSYVSLVESELILSSRPAAYKTLWTAADNYLKEQLLIWATALLDDWIIYPGSYTTPHQGLGFPRTGVSNLGGYYFPTASVPYFMKRSCTELALCLLTENLVQEPSRGLDAIKVGPIALDFSKGESEKPRVIPRSVFSILYPYGCRLRMFGTANVGSLPLVRA